LSERQVQLMSVRGGQKQGPRRHAETKSAATAWMQPTFTTGGYTCQMGTHVAATTAATTAVVAAAAATSKAPTLSVRPPCCSTRGPSPGGRKRTRPPPASTCQQQGHACKRWWGERHRHKSDVKATRIQPCRRQLRTTQAVARAHDRQGSVHDDAVCQNCHKHNRRQQSSPLAAAASPSSCTVVATGASSPQI